MGFMTEYRRWGSRHAGFMTRFMTRDTRRQRWASLQGAEPPRATRRPGAGARRSNAHRTPRPLQRATLHAPVAPAARRDSQARRGARTRRLQWGSGRAGSAAPATAAARGRAAGGDGSGGSSGGGAAAWAPPESDAERGPRGHWSRPLGAAGGAEERQARGPRRARGGEVEAALLLRACPADARLEAGTLREAEAAEAPERWAGAGEGADRPRAWLYLGASLASALAAAWLWGAGLRGAR